MKRITAVAMCLLALVALAGCRQTPTPEPTLDLGDIGARGGSPRERICINCADDSYIRLGGDLLFYSDNLTTQTIGLAGDTGNVTLATGDLTLTAGDLGLTAGSATLTAGDLTITAGDLTLSDGDLVVADDLRITAQTSITVTNGAAFTPTGTYTPIAAAGEVTPTITAGATAGNLAIIVNTSDQTVNLADSGTLMLTAAFAMGQYDVLTLLSDGTNWLEVSRANN